MRMLDETTASAYFGSMAESYDSLIRRAVPRYDEMLVRLVDYLPRSASNIMELGCGTGNLSLALAERYPEASLTFLDAAPEMLATTSARLERAYPSSVGRTRFVESVFEKIDSRLGTFDLVTSSISLHHVADKESLYKNIYALVEPGGTFRFSDQLRGGSVAIHELNWRRWLEFCRSPENCSEEEVASLLEHAAAHDHYTPLQEHFRLLRIAGFTKLDCVWRNLIWGIVTADCS
ncbi:MAG: class I SAM-dependent methyltransferase [Acidobacteria bacterium]|nr:class I SAM-dependent methyltransferase [Acidobacteriota bacterium]